jgi:hypothetical protein
MAKYRKKPVVIEAVQWTGQNFGEIHMLNHDITGAPQDSHALYIPTLEGVMRADLGDWIIKGVAGEFYPCKDSIFKATYEPVDER